MSETITIVEVGPRDGLQNEPTALSLATTVSRVWLSRDTEKRVPVPAEDAKTKAPRGCGQTGGSSLSH